MRFLYCIALILLFVLGCKKKDVAFQNIPEISFVSATPSSVKEYLDSIVITISYKDGDGDIGQNDPNINNLFVVDSRNSVTYSFRISQLAPDNANVPIQGNLNVVIKNTGITDNSNSQTVTYTVYLFDRNGNKSNEVSTNGIVVVK